jgi:hypothetical protein
MALLTRMIAHRLEGSRFGVSSHDLAYFSHIAIRLQNVAAGGSRECPNAIFSPNAF